MTAPTPRQPTGPELQRLQRALLDAFPSYEALAQMVRFRLDTNIRAITTVTGANLGDVVFDLIQHYAEKEGGLHRLLAAARKQNPGNAELAEIAAEFAPIRFLPIERRPDRGGSGGINIGTVNAVNFTTGDQVIDQRGSTFHLGGGDPKDSQKLDKLLSGQQELKDGQRGLSQQMSALEASLLERYDESERVLVSGVIGRLGAQQQTQLAAVLHGIEASRDRDAALLSSWRAIEESLALLISERNALPAEVTELNQAISAPQMDVRHRLKLALPIIPWLISYEGELDLGSSVNLETTWRALVARFGGRG